MALSIASGITVEPWPRPEFPERHTFTDISTRESRVDAQSPNQGFLCT